MQLGSGIAVAVAVAVVWASGYISNSIARLETSICCRCSLKMTKRKRKEKKRKEVVRIMAEVKEAWGGSKGRDMMLLVMGVSRDGQTMRQLLPQSLKGSNQCWSCPLQVEANKNRPKHSR